MNDMAKSLTAHLVKTLGEKRQAFQDNLVASLRSDSLVVKESADVKECVGADGKADSDCGCDDEDSTDEEPVKESKAEDLKKEIKSIEGKIARATSRNKVAALRRELRQAKNKLKLIMPALKEEKEYDVFLDEDTDELFIETDDFAEDTEFDLEDSDGEEELDEETLNEGRKIVIRVNSKGKRTRKVICGKGMVSKRVNGSVRCIRMSGVQKLRKRLAQRKRLRTLKRKGAGAQRRLNIKRQRAMRRRKSMGLSRRK